jgi:hypothetical protein
MLSGGCECERECAPLNLHVSNTKTSMLLPESHHTRRLLYVTGEQPVPSLYNLRDLAQRRSVVFDIV